MMPLLLACKHPAPAFTQQNYAVQQGYLYKKHNYNENRFTYKLEHKFKIRIFGFQISIKIVVCLIFKESISPSAH
jgi:hypothetical protein